MTKINEQKTTEEKIEILSQKVAAHRGGRAGRIPDDLRGEVLKTWRESGQPMDPFGKRIGVAGASIANWVKARQKKPPIARVPSKKVKKKQFFKPIRVVPEPVGGQPKPGHVFDLELASGARVKGLRMEDLAELMRIQGGGQ